MNPKALLATTALMLALSAVSCGKDDNESSVNIAYGEATNTTPVTETTEDSDETKDFKMPDFYGMDYNVAVSQYGNNIQFEMDGSDYNELEAGLIYSQDVDPDTEFKSGDVLKVKISKGMETVEMPDVVNMNSELAKDQLAMLGLVCEIRNSPSTEVQPGYIISTEPEADTKVNKGATIVLYVSNGAEISVDDYVGQVADDAVTLAEYAGLKPVTEFKDSDEEKGKIIEQSIEKGTIVDVGTEIIFYISN